MTRARKNGKNNGQRKAKRNGGSNAVTMPRTMELVRFQPDVFGFPDRLLTKLRYSDFHAVTSTTGAVGSYVFRWNSTFDPNQTGTGHQPLYRDVYASVYDHYAVVSARAIIRCTYVDADSPVFVCVNTDDDTSPSTTAQTLAEMSHGVSTLLTPLSGSHSYEEIIVNWDCKEILGVDPYTSEEYKTAVGSNPTEESCLIISAATTDTTTATVNFQIILEQKVLWTELTTPTQS